MKKFISLLIATLFIIFAIYFLLTKNNPDSPYEIKKSYTVKEQKSLKAARGVIKRAYFGSLITLDKNNRPKARLMEPFPPDRNFTIFLATNPHSRKVEELKHNSTATLHYLDKPRTGYVSLYGHAYLVTNDSLKKIIWKKGWERFYKNRDKDYMLIKFIPDYLEVISIRDSLNGNPENWQPSHVKF